MEQCGLHPQVHFTTWDDYAIMSMVESGLGIAILSRHTLIHTAPGNLVELDVEGFPIPNRWYLVRWRTKNPSPAALAFSRFAEVPLEAPTLPD